MHWRGRRLRSLGGGTLSLHTSYIRFLEDRALEQALDKKIASRLEKRRARQSDYDDLVEKAASSRPRQWNVVDSLKFIALHRLFRDKPLPLARYALKMARKTVDSIPALKKRAQKSPSRKTPKATGSKKDKP